MSIPSTVTPAVTLPPRHQSPLGMELISRKRGGTIVKSITPNSQAHSLNIKRGFVPLRIGNVDIQHSPLVSIQSDAGAM